ncbi:hypothetical protein BDZ97DRAFT_1768703 [Flammula alnicola]|nr:hypothetical protein BDZ97DRAFT_1768703 [Flammula alnicola]
MSAPSAHTHQSGTPPSQLLLFALTQRRAYLSCLMLSGLTTQMGNYMRGLEVTRSPEPCLFACSSMARFLAHVAGETPPSFAFLQTLTFLWLLIFTLACRGISEADMDSEPPFQSWSGWLSTVRGDLGAFTHRSPSSHILPRRHRCLRHPTMDLDERVVAAHLPRGEAARLTVSDAILDVVGRPEERFAVWKGKLVQNSAPSLTSSPRSHAAAAKLAAILIKSPTGLPLARRSPWILSSPPRLSTQSRGSGRCSKQAPSTRGDPEPQS